MEHTSLLQNLGTQRQSFASRDPMGTVVPNLFFHRLGAGQGVFAMIQKTLHLSHHLLPGKIPWTEEPGGLQSMGLLRVRHD